MKSLSDVQPYRVMFVDGMNLCARSYHGMAGLSFNGRRTGMMFGVARLVLDWRKQSPGIKTVFLWEGRNSWRKTEYPIYKANRKKGKGYADDKRDYFNCVDRVRATLPAMGVEQQWAETYEADDTVWTAMAQWENAKKIFVSTDWDWWPLVYHGDVLYQNDVLVESDMQRRFVKKYNCEPIMMNRLWLFKVLTGDSSDGISGVPMFPKKLAATLCNDDTVNSDNLVDKLRDMGKLTWADKVKSHDWLISRNVDLVTIRRPDRVNVEVVEGKFDQEGFEKALLHDGMSDLHDRLVKGW